MFGFPKSIIFLLLVLLAKFEIGKFTEANKNGGLSKWLSNTFQNKENDGKEDGISKFLKPLEELAQKGDHDGADKFIKSIADGINSLSCWFYEAVYPIFQLSTSDVKFLLFTRANTSDPCNLLPNEEALEKCKYNASLPTKVIIHGFIKNFHKEDTLLFVMKDKLLEEGEYNVVVLNYTSYTHYQKYQLTSLAANSLGATLIGLRVSAWIDFLKKHAGAKPKDFHLISTSMGTIVASYAGKSTCGLGWITFMDAQGVFTRFFPEFLRMSHKDAKFTEAIHTNGANFITGGFGLKQAFADIDYYVNGGSEQPLCKNQTLYREVFNKTDDPMEDNDCDHYSPFFYYLASFRKDCHFNGLICDSYEDYNSGKCNSGNAVHCQMFSHTVPKLDLPPYSKCYLNTSAEYPFCLN